MSKKSLLAAGVALLASLPLGTRAQTAQQQQANTAIGVYAMYFAIVKTCGFSPDPQLSKVVTQNIDALSPFASLTEELTRQVIARFEDQMQPAKNKVCGDPPDQKEFETTMSAFDKAARGAAAGLPVSLVPLPETAAAQLVFASGSDVERVLEIAKAHGEATLGKDSDGDPQIKVKSPRANWSIAFYGCDKGENCKTIQLHYGIATQDKVAPAKVNDWNRTKRWAKAYIDKDNDPNISYDINTRYGVTQAGLNATIANFVAQIEDFKAAVLK